MSVRHCIDYFKLPANDLGAVKRFYAAAFNDTMLALTGETAGPSAIKARRFATIRFLAVLRDDETAVAPPLPTVMREA